MDTIEEIIMNNLFQLVKFHSIPQRMKILSVFLGYYISYRNEWSGNGDVEMDAFTLAYEETMRYYKDKYAKT